MGKTAQRAPSASRWSRFWRLLRDLEEAAMNTSAVDILHLRISMLEREVAEIKANQPRAREIQAALNVDVEIPDQGRDR